MAALAVLLAIAAAGYYASLFIWPFTNCGRCKGGGRNAGSNRRWFGACRKCGGSGRKERLGVRLFRRRR
jgi:hypothetical protein